MEKHIMKYLICRAANVPAEVLSEAEMAFLRQDGYLLAPDNSITDKTRALVVLVRHHAGI